ncbi:BCHE [Branchiostoma lanceolatum]|uniref:Carboxylic ester hydrolase n=1 Tax=Branchiostoma lanceolatum TaxID=7740 RepID=A0A8J9Z0I7_BRALA|nr:BCHE [Branchiostoma lanceolatum]
MSILYSLHLFACAFGLLWCDSAQVTAQSGPLIETSFGKVQGLSTEKARVFYGIPYAAPPKGPLRWKAPEEPASWAPNVLQVTQKEPACPQNCTLPPHMCPDKTDEDCLYMNIFTPLNASPQSLIPVMLWIHGGQFIRGSGDVILYDGQYYANQTGVVVVTINYRLGALGFLSAGSGKTASKGNYGIMDQRLAMQWVQNNIAAFGGDPKQVTLFGESAGGMSISIHLCSNQSASLFKQGIIESDPLGIPYRTQAEATRLGKYFAEELGCSHGDMACMAGKQPQDIIVAQTKAGNKLQVSLKYPVEIFVPWGPHVDGVELLEQTVDTFRKGHAQKKPIIIGTTSEEAVMYVYEGFGKPVSALGYYEYMTGFFLPSLAVEPWKVLEIFREYPADKSSNDQRPIMATIGTEWLFTCANRAAVRGHVGAQNDVFLYQFAHAFSFPGWGPHFQFCVNHSCHGSELPYVWHGNSMDLYTYTAEEVTLADLMACYWSNFAHTGNPNKGPCQKKSAPEWPAYDTDARKYINFQTPASLAMQDLDGASCDFWDSINDY